MTRTLIVIDMQNDFITGSLGTAEVLTAMEMCQIEITR